MKICYLGSHIAPHVKVFIDFFTKKGHEVHTFGRYNPYSEENVIFHYLPKGESPNFKKKVSMKESRTIPGFLTSKDNYFSKMFINGIKLCDFVTIGHLIRKIKPDIIHGHEALGWGVRTALNKKCPTILSCWGSDVFRFPWNSNLNYIKVNYALKNVDLIHVGTPMLKDYIIKKFGIDKNIIKVIPWGVNLNLFNIKKVNRKEVEYFKSKYCINDDDIVILYPKGFRNIEVQNYLNLLKAFSQLVKKNKNCKLILMTYGKKSGIERVSKTINENNLKRKVILINKLIPQELMPMVCSLSDINVVIPDMDHLSGSIIEGMMFDNIPVLSNIKPYKKYFQEDRNCYYVNQKNPNDIMKTLQHCIKNMDEIKNRISKVNKEFIKMNFDRDKQMPKFENTYQQLIKKNKF